MASLTFFTGLVLFIVLARLAEGVVSQMNTQWAQSRGGVEHGAKLAPAIQLWAAGLYVCALAEAWFSGHPFVAPLAVLMTVVTLMAEALRWWAIQTLGPHWTARILVVPGMVVVGRGPYRFLRHPGYLAAIAQSVALPLVHSAWWTATVFTIVGVALMARRVGLEEAALGYAELDAAKLGYSLR